MRKVSPSIKKLRVVLMVSISIVMTVILVNIARNNGYSNPEVYRELRSYIFSIGKILILLLINFVFLNFLNRLLLIRSDSINRPMAKRLKQPLLNSFYSNFIIICFSLFYIITSTDYKSIPQVTTFLFIVIFNLTDVLDHYLEYYQNRKYFNRDSYSIQAFDHFIDLDMYLFKYNDLNNFSFDSNIIYNLKYETKYQYEYLYCYCVHCFNNKKYDEFEQAISYAYQEHENNHHNQSILMMMLFNLKELTLKEKPDIASLKKYDIKNKEITSYFYLDYLIAFLHSIDKTEILEKFVKRQTNLGWSSISRATCDYMKNYLDWTEQNDKL